MMANIFHFISGSYSSAFVALCAVVIGFVIQNYYKKWKRRQRWNSIDRDVVLLHSLPPSRNSNPNLGPFIVKLETFFRMAAIKYEVETEQPMGPKGKVPWITFNGRDYSDSQLIMQYLLKYFEKDLSKDLPAEQKAVARSMQIMAEEHLYWGLVSWRYIEDPERRVFDISDMIPSYLRPLFPIFKYMLKKALYYQGTGRHTVTEIRNIMTKDIQALSCYLGSKPFFMGEEPKEVDCCIYGQISQFVWNTPGSPYEKLIKEKYKNLHDYCLRMRERFWAK